MFSKYQFEIKKIEKLKHSESKTLFPDFLNNCFTNKQQICKAKIQFTCGTNGVVFALDKEPMLFQIGNLSKTEFFPTVYFLWAHPTIFPILFIQHSTFEFLQKGADLTIPGIELINLLPLFCEENIVVISTISQNKESGMSTICGPMAVGRAFFSSEEIKQRKETGQKGKAVEILHIFGDLLWESGSERLFPQFDENCAKKDISIWDLLENKENYSNEQNLKEQKYKQQKQEYQHTKIPPIQPATIKQQNLPNSKSIFEKYTKNQKNTLNNLHQSKSQISSSSSQKVSTNTSQFMSSSCSTSLSSPSYYNQRPPPIPPRIKVDSRALEQQQYRRNIDFLKKRIRDNENNQAVIRKQVKHSSKNSRRNLDQLELLKWELELDVRRLRFFEGLDEQEELEKNVFANINLTRHPPPSGQEMEELTHQFGEIPDNTEENIEVFRNGSFSPIQQDFLDSNFEHHLEESPPISILKNKKNVKSNKRVTFSDSDSKIQQQQLCENRTRDKLHEWNTFEDAVELIRKSKSIIILSGAGISVSCGIPDFRSEKGIYSRLKDDFPQLPDPHSMFDIDFFRQNPSPFYAFAKEIFPGQFRPSISHKFIKFLEEEGKLLRNYTQNIDTLERLAGINNLIECHGSFARSTCLNCKIEIDSEEIRQNVYQKKVAFCQNCKIGIIKPNITFFGEDLSEQFHNQMALDSTKVDLLIIIGSSLHVRPVSLIPYNINNSIPQILINRELLPNYNADIKLLGDCDKILSLLAISLKEEGQICQKMIQELESRPSNWNNLLLREQNKSNSRIINKLNIEQFKKQFINNNEQPPNLKKIKIKEEEESTKLWEGNYVKVEKYLTEFNSTLLVSPNINIFKGAEFYYNKNEDIFVPKAKIQKINKKIDDSDDENLLLNFGENSSSSSNNSSNEREGECSFSLPCDESTYLDNKNQRQSSSCPPEEIK